MCSRRGGHSGHNCARSPGASVKFSWVSNAHPDRVFLFILGRHSAYVPGDPHAFFGALQTPAPSKSHTSESIHFALYSARINCPRMTFSIDSAAQKSQNGVRLVLELISARLIATKLEHALAANAVETQRAVPIRALSGVPLKVQPAQPRSRLPPTSGKEQSFYVLLLLRFFCSPTNFCIPNLQQKSEI